jgi:glycerol-3-phosphate O-acyltransferase
MEHSVYFSIIDRNERFSKVEDFSHVLMNSIEQIIPVLPFSLTAAVFKNNPEKKMSLFDVKAEVHQLIEQLESAGAGIYYPDGNYEETIEAALGMMKIRRMIVQTDGYYQMAPEMANIVSYYANSIGHWLG